MPQRIHSTGSLDAFNPILVTPVIGTEFPKDSCNIVDDILNAPNSEQRIRDLAVLGTSHSIPSHPQSHLPTHPSNKDIGINSRGKRRRLLPRPAQPNQRPPKTAHPPNGPPHDPSLIPRPPHPPRNQRLKRIRRPRPPNQHDQLRRTKETLQGIGLYPYGGCLA